MDQMQRNRRRSALAALTGAAAALLIASSAPTAAHEPTGATQVDAVGQPSEGHGGDQAPPASARPPQRQDTSESPARLVPERTPCAMVRTVPPRAPGTELRRGDGDSRHGDGNLRFFHLEADLGADEGLEHFMTYRATPVCERLRPPRG